ncbi:hypothetical protein NDU88_006580 [Pleurodeles waltl]|uniref:Uncharacterized protein n=1 Tax=Pleurodeles waltl TaxID=8319 RepID=A0AAV7LAN6_PLEWA|nr:hypothetical protein NDU88_006580 [Pleurodeles waltl]
MGAALTAQVFPPANSSNRTNLTMAYYADGDEQYQELQEIPVQQQMAERLVEALGYLVQDSVNWALIQALKPLTNFGRREFLGEGSQQPRSHSGDSRGASGLSLQRAGGSSSAEILAQMAASVLRDHEYGVPSPQDASFPSTWQAFMNLPHPSQSQRTRKRSPFHVKNSEKHDIPRLT